MSDMETVPLQATIGGMSATSPEVYTVIGAYDRASGVLLIDAARVIKPGKPERRIGDSAAVSNNPASQARDILFIEDHMQEAIAAYLDFAGRGLLEFDGSVAQHNPHTAIELDGLDKTGRKYRLNTDISNGKVSVIALCWLAMRQARIGAAMSAQDDYDDLFDVTTVGIDQGAYVQGVRIGADGWPEE